MLDLAKAQKVDLEKLSITKLADQFHEFYYKKKKYKFRNCIRIFVNRYLAYIFKIKKLLLPESDDEEFKALEVAEKLKLQLKNLS